MLDGTNGNAVMDDDWSAAIAEQAEQSNGALTSAANGGSAQSAPGSGALAAGIHAQPQVFGQLNANATAALPGNGAAAGAGAVPPPVNDIQMILDIPVTLTVELGRTRIPIKQILHLGQGSVVELDNLAGEPMDVLVNGCLIAQGDVVVVNEKFGIRLTDIVTPSERMRKLNR